MSRFLLDTHILLWVLTGPRQLRPEERTAIENPEHQIYVSAASIWEMAIKAGLGKLRMPDGLEAELARMRMEQLPISHRHALRVRSLPLRHRDPFDRMLVAQALDEDLTLITRDSQIQAYEVSYLGRDA